MKLTDIISGLGVALILTAYLGITLNRFSLQSPAYWGLNILGGILATIGAVLLKSLPFAILETTWTITSFVGLYKCLIPRKTS